MAKTAIGKLRVAQKQEGRDKTFWLDVGILLANEDRTEFSIKQNAIPTGAWDGWISVFPMDDKEDEKPRRSEKKPARGGDTDLDSDDIPF